MTALASAREALDSLILDVPDWPEPGVVFKDITPVLADHTAFTHVIEALAAPGRDASGRPVDKVVGMEARGFILGGAVAHQVSAGFIPIRKKGKLPHKRVSIAYSPTSIDIEVADNGRGGKASSDGAGHGLRGMHERVSSMGGRLNVGPGLGGGYLVRASLPVPTGGQQLGSRSW